jgi:CO/xanthine dehydrogenase FAD-binding subunit
MAHTALAPLIGAEFDKFLYAPIREDRNGTPLSVLSALARLDVDPWKEAASLALMPKATAAVRLTALISALPDEQTSDTRAKSIAANLVALLPKATGFSVGSSDGVFAAVGPQRAQVRFALGALAIMVLIALALSASLSSAPVNGAKLTAAPVGDAATAPQHERTP